MSKISGNRCVFVEKDKSDIPNRAMSFVLGAPGVGVIKITLHSFFFIRINFIRTLRLRKI